MYGHAGSSAAFQVTQGNDEPDQEGADGHAVDAGRRPEPYRVRPGEEQRQRGNRRSVQWRQRQHPQQNIEAERGGDFQTERQTR